MRSGYWVFLGMCLCGAWDQESSAHPPDATEWDVCLTEYCGPNTECHHELGSFYCTCKAGFYSKSGDKKFAGSAESTCRDYDECYTVKMICGINATCYNTMGGFYCLCHSGFARASGETRFTDYRAGCEDIDECLQKPCAPHEVCHNTEGSFFCSHTPWSVTSSLKTTHSPFLNCLSNLLKNQSIIDNCFNKDVTSFGNKFIADGSEVESISVFLDAMENFALAAALASPTQELKPITTTHLDIDVQVIKPSSLRSQSNTPRKITLRAKENTLDVYLTTVTGEKRAGAAVVAFLSYEELQSLQTGDFIEEGRTRPFRLNSGVVSAVIRNRRLHQLTDTVNITLRHTKESVAEGQTFCVYWNHSGPRSHWSPVGCTVIQSNSSHTSCGCLHLSSFAILVSTSQERSEKDQYLTWITLVGLSTSLVCLSLAITTFLFCVQTKNINISIHINLCVSMFLGELLFLLGIERTGSKVVCALVAGCLHYLFLVACTWMCVEGIHLHLMVQNLQRINNASVHRALRWFMYPFAYGVPAVIVIVSVATYPAGYGSPLYCWLSVKKGLIWSFIGPICTIILFNMILFAVTLYKLRAQITHLNTEVTKIKNMRMLTLKAIAQGFVLGCTWILSLFHFHDTTTVLTYLFTIIHSFQGTLIFLILCVLNPQVRDGYRICWKRICSNRKKTSFTDSASSSVPMTTPSYKETLKVEWSGSESCSNDIDVWC